MNAGKSYGDRPIVRDLSLRVMRGDRIGVIGPNGAGKSTLLKLVLGELAPMAGSVRLGSNVQVAYFDPDARTARPRTDAHRYHQPRLRVGRDRPPSASMS